MNFNRALVSQRLRERIAATFAITNVLVVTNVVDLEAREYVYVGTEHTGDWSIASLSSGAWRDEWTVRIEVVTNVPGTTFAEAEERCMELVSTVLTVVLTDPGLTTPTPITDLVGLNAGTNNAQRLEGPNTGTLPSNDGFGSSAHIYIPFFARHC